MSTKYEMIDPIEKSDIPPFPHSENIRGILCKFNEGSVKHEYSPTKSRSGHAQIFSSDLSINYRQENGVIFVNKLIEFMKDENTQVVPGTYKYIIEGTHFYNEITRLWVFIKSNGDFLCAWKLDEDQIEYLMDPTIRNVN